MRVYVTRLTFVDGKLKDSSSGLSFNNPLAMSDKKRGQEPANNSDAPQPGSGVLMEKE